MMDLVYALCEFLGLTLDAFCVWLCMLLLMQGFGILMWGLYEIRRPSPVEDLINDRHFGGV